MRGLREWGDLRWRRMDDLAVAHLLADEARRVSLGWFGGTIASRTKPDGSIVTDADEAVEDALRHMLASRRPADAVLGEERGLTGAGERVWLLDGIDGTDSFAIGGNEWGTLIALQVAGEVVLGIADAPVFDRRYWASRGEGAHLMTGTSFTLHPELRVSEHGEMRQCRMIVPPLQWCRDARDLDAVDRLRAATVPVDATNHPAIQVAAGDCDAALFFKTGPWDVAAPAIILEEAGGRFSDLDGNRRLDAGCVLYSNGVVHDQLLEILTR